MSATTSTTTGHIEQGGATVNAAEELLGGSGFNAAIAKSEHDLFAASGASELAAQKAQEYWDFRGQSQLRKDEWKQIDDTLVRIAQENLRGVADLQSAGLTIPLDLGTLRWEWEDVSDISDAEVDMGAETASDEDAPKFTENGVPLPVIHKGYYFNLRKLRASRNRGEPLDTTMAGLAARKVMEKAEDILFNGHGTTVDGDQIYGYTDHPDRNTVTGGANWSTASTTADDMRDDVLACIEALEDDDFDAGNTGYWLYLRRDQYQELRAEDTGTSVERSALARLEEEFGDMLTIRNAGTQLSDGNAVMVKPTQETVQLAVASDMQSIEWDSRGGMVLHNKVMASIIPVLKSDQDNKMGLAHMTGI